MPIYHHPAVKKVAYYLVRRLEGWMVDLHEVHFPTAAHGLALNWVIKARSGLLASIEDAPGRAEIWHGREKESGELLRAAYVGNAQAYQAHSPEYLKRILFGGEDVECAAMRDVAVVSSKQTGKALAGEADLVIIEESDALRWQPEYGSWRIFPTSVHLILKYFKYKTWDDIEKGMYLQKRKIRTALRNGLSFEISRSEDDFDWFYDRMYAPMMEKRHAGYGIIHPKEHVRHQFQHGLLGMVREPGGMPVGGGLFTLRKKTATLLHTGLLDGDMRWYEFGASSAMYYHSIRWFYDQQFHYYNAGGARPFKSDGLYEFKRRWGLKPVKDVWNLRHWLFWVPNGNKTALQWLNSHENVLEDPKPETALV